MTPSLDRPAAIVVGLCGHGLGIVRALHRNGVPVIALEADTRLPGVRTRCAKVRIVPDINREGLIDSLIALAAELPASPKPVLLLTSDRMVETVGRHVGRILPHYKLAWGDAAERLLPLLGKDSIERRCRETGHNYPRTVVLEDLERIDEHLAGLRFPVIAKPTRPVSAFKTVVADSAEALAAARGRISGSLPVIVQEFIPGGDEAIRFGALYLDHGKPLARFEGRKLRSRPMGHTTLAVSAVDDDIHRLALRFFDGLEFSGPVSLELKQAPDGTQWVIEPTVGRTDFWADLCVANGVNLPLIEYCHQAGLPLPTATQQDRRVWMNGERDPGALLWLAARQPGFLLARGVRGLFASLSDPQPFLLALGRFLGALPLRAARKAGRLALRRG